MGVTPPAPTLTGVSSHRDRFLGVSSDAPLPFGVASSQPRPATGVAPPDDSAGVSSQRFLRVFLVGVASSHRLDLEDALFSSFFSSFSSLSSHLRLRFFGSSSFTFFSVWSVLCSFSPFALGTSCSSSSSSSAKLVA